jgi:hypothetical protein
LQQRIHSDPFRRVDTISFIAGTQFVGTHFIGTQFRQRRREVYRNRQSERASLTGTLSDRLQFNIDRDKIGETSTAQPRYPREVVLQQWLASKDFYLSRSRMTHPMFVSVPRLYP